MQYVKILPSMKISNVIQKYCHSNPLPRLLTVDSNEITVTFHDINDGAVSKKAILHVHYEGVLEL